MILTTTSIATMKFNADAVKKIHFDNIEDICRYDNAENIKGILSKYQGPSAYFTDDNASGYQDRERFRRRFVKVTETWTNVKFRDGQPVCVGEVDEDRFLGRFDMDLETNSYVPTAYLSSRGVQEVDSLEFGRELTNIFNQNYKPMTLDYVMKRKEHKRLPLPDHAPMFERILSDSKDGMEAACTHTPSWVHHEPDWIASRSFKVSLYDHTGDSGYPRRIINNMEVIYDTHRKVYMHTMSDTAFVCQTMTPLMTQAVINVAMEFHSYCGNWCAEWDKSVINGCTVKTENSCGSCLPSKVVSTFK